MNKNVSFRLKFRQNMFRIISLMFGATKNSIIKVSQQLMGSLTMKTIYKRLKMTIAQLCKFVQLIRFHCNYNLWLKFQEKQVLIGMIILSCLLILFNNSKHSGHYLLIILGLKRLQLFIWPNKKESNNIFMKFKKDISLCALLISIHTKISDFLLRVCLLKDA